MDVVTVIAGLGSGIEGLPASLPRKREGWWQRRRIREVETSFPDLAGDGEELEHDLVIITERQNHPPLDDPVT